MKVYNHKFQFVMYIFYPKLFPWDNNEYYYVNSFQ